MIFTPINAGEYFVRSGGGREEFPQDGTGYILNGYFTSLAGSPSPSTAHFGLWSVDLAEFSIIYNVSWPVQFIGYHADGSTVTTNFTLDGVIDGSGPIADFQTFYFDSRFSDLVRFEVPSVRFAMDNLVYFNVPEPRTGVLFVVGSAILLLRCSKRSRL
jgi:hypothetical protein